MPVAKGQVRTEHTLSTDVEEKMDDARALVRHHVGPLAEGPHDREYRPEAEEAAQSNGQLPLSALELRWVADRSIRCRNGRACELLPDLLELKYDGPHKKTHEDAAEDEVRVPANPSATRPDSGQRSSDRDYLGSPNVHLADDMSLIRQDAKEKHANDASEGKDLKLHVDGVAKVQYNQRTGAQEVCGPRRKPIHESELDRT